MLDFDAGDGGDIFVEGAYWETLNGSNLTSGNQELCLRGNIGAIQSSETFDSQGRPFGPVIFLERENSTEGPWMISIDGSEPSIQVMDGQWKIPNGIVSIGDVLSTPIEDPLSAHLARLQHKWTRGRTGQ